MIRRRGPRSILIGLAIAAGLTGRAPAEYVTPNPGLPPHGGTLPAGY